MSIVRCRVCLRALKDAPSTTAGIGPRCAKRREEWLAFLRKHGHLGAELGEIRAGEDVVCSLNRGTGNLDSNIPRKFNWCGMDRKGYGFAEPAATDFAINILHAFLGPGFVKIALGQKFAHHFLHHQPVEGAVIKRAAILEWLSQNNAKPKEV